MTVSIKSLIKKIFHWDALPDENRELYRRLAHGHVFENAFLAIGSVLGLHMNVLARLARTDKYGAHRYTPIYHRHFRKLRRKRINLLEIGVGGYSDERGGKSLDLWRAYFPRAQIAAIDIYDKTYLSKGRVKVFRCSQTDFDGLARICDSYGGFDIVIDDGSHLNEHQIETFGFLFNRLRDGGIYVVEDTQTSYWPAYGGGAVGTEEHQRSCVQFFKSLVDGLNYEEFLESNYRPTDLDTKITSIEFHHNVIIVTKGDNREGSPMVAELREQLLNGRTEDGSF